jgi:hypothetical protein
MDNDNDTVDDGPGITFRWLTLKEWAFALGFALVAFFGIWGLLQIL